MATWEFIDKDSARLVLVPPMDRGDAASSGQHFEAGVGLPALEAAGNDQWQSIGHHIVPTTATTAPHKSAKVSPSP